MRIDLQTRKLLQLISRRYSLQLVFVLHQLCVSSSLFAQLPTIELYAISQSAAQTGTTINLNLTAGSRTDELSRLIFSREGVDARQVPGQPRLLSDEAITTGTFKVSVSSSTSPGLVDVRGLGRFGASNPRALLITEKPVDFISTDHTNLSTAIALKPSTIIVSHCQPLKRNYYSLTMQAGDTLRAVCYAKQLDSQAIPHMILLDPHRAELAEGRAVGDWPAELQHTAKQDGEYLLAIHDFLHQGGSQHAYALEAALEANPSTSGDLELNALLRPSIAREIENRFDEEVLLNVSASFDANRTVAHDMELKKDQSLWIEVRSQRDSQLTDPRLIIYRLAVASAESPEQSLSQIIEQDDPPAIGDVVRNFSQDPQLLWKVPEDGNYRFALLDQENGPRPADATAYSLIVRTAKPRFKLLAYIPYPANDINTSRPIGSNLLRGGTESVRFLLLRQGGFADAVEVTVNGLPAGVSASPLIIPANSTSGCITLACTEDASAWNGPLHFVGRSLSAEPILAEPQAATVLWPRMPTRNVIQTRLCSNLWFSINDQDTAPLLVQLGDESVPEVAPGAKLSLPIKITRRAGGHAACLLRSKDLPPKTSLGDITIAADKNEGTAELAVAADTPPGEYTFWMQNETKVNWRDNPQSLVREEAYLTKLNERLAQTSDAAQRAPLDAAIQSTAARIEELKKATAEKGLTVWLPSTTVRVRVVAKP